MSRGLLDLEAAPVRRRPDREAPKAKGLGT